jgi:hypothetical protein
MTFKEDDLAALINAEKQRGRKRPIDLAEKQKQLKLRSKLILALEEKRWGDVEAAITELFGDSEEKLRSARRALSAFRQANP